MKKLEITNNERMYLMLKAYHRNDTELTLDGLTTTINVLIPLFDEEFTNDDIEYIINKYSKNVRELK